MLSEADKNTAASRYASQSFERMMRHSSLGETMDEVNEFWSNEKKAALTGMPEEQADWEAGE